MRYPDAVPLPHQVDRETAAQIDGVPLRREPWDHGDEHRVDDDAYSVFQLVGMAAVGLLFVGLGAVGIYGLGKMGQAIVEAIRAGMH